MLPRWRPSCTSSSFIPSMASLTFRPVVLSSMLGPLRFVDEREFMPACRRGLEHGSEIAGGAFGQRLHIPARKPKSRAVLPERIRRHGVDALLHRPHGYGRFPGGGHRHAGKGRGAPRFLVVAIEVE